MAEIETYHAQKVEDFASLAKEHLDGEIEFYEQVSDIKKPINLLSRLTSSMTLLLIPHHALGTQFLSLFRSGSNQRNTAVSLLCSALYTRT